MELDEAASLITGRYAHSSNPSQTSFIRLPKDAEAEDPGVRDRLEQLNRGSPRGWRSNNARKAVSTAACGLPTKGLLSNMCGVTTQLQRPNCRWLRGGE